MKFFYRPQGQQVKAQDDVEKELVLFEREEKLRIKESLFQERENVLSEVKSNWSRGVSDIGANEHDFHQNKETRGIEIAKLDATILLKRELYEEIADQKDVEIKLLKESNSTIATNYKEMIELLKTQVEVLTAKLTELKITDLHINASVVDKK